MTMTARTSAPKMIAPGSIRHWMCAAGSFIVMMGASILLSGLSLFTAPIVTDLYWQKDASGAIVTHVLPNGVEAPVEINGGQAAFLLYFTFMTFAIVLPLMFFAGKLLAKYGARIMLAVGGIIMTGGLALFATAQNNLMFYAAGAIIGIGYGLSVALIPPALVNTWFVAKRGLVLGIVLACTGVGGLLWAAIGPSLAESEMGWRGVIWIMAGVMLAATVIPAAFLIHTRPEDCGLVAYGATISPTGEVLEGGQKQGTLPGFTYDEAKRSSVFWIASASFFIFGLVVAVTQVLSIVFRTAAYADPLDRTSWSPSEIAFYSSLFMLWLAALVLWKPILGILNDKFGLVFMIIASMTMLSLAMVYLPHMIYGSPVIFMYLAMVFMSSGISNATVTPPLVVAKAMGGREFGKIFSLAIAFYYAGNAIGAPIWGALGTRGLTQLGLYLSPVALAIFVAMAIYATKKGAEQYAPQPEPAREKEGASSR